jgi:hypothetical protein
MIEELLKRIADIRTALQALIADASAKYDGDEVISMLNDADQSLEDAEAWEPSDEEEEEEEEEPSTDEPA